MSISQPLNKFRLFSYFSGKQALNPEHEAKGAMKAGYVFHNLANLQIIGYRYFDDSTLNANQKEVFNNSEMRKKMNVFTDDEVKDLVDKHISQIYSEIQVIFIKCYFLYSFYNSKYFICRLYLIIIVVPIVVSKEMKDFCLHFVTWKKYLHTQKIWKRNM